MQPYFFPYFGYFDHIFRCDEWVVFDIVQYASRTWMNRNRILHPVHGWEYLTANVKKFHRNDKICEIFLCSVKDTLVAILDKIGHYKKAPYFKQVSSLLVDAFNDAPSDSLTDVNVSCLNAVCKYLDIRFDPVIASREKFKLPEITYPGQWALEIATIMNADIYLNTPGGREIFRPEEFADRNIKLAFTRVPEYEYGCPGFEFQPHLSILDVLFWNDPKEIRDHMGKSSIDYA